MTLVTASLIGCLATLAYGFCVVLVLKFYWLLVEKLQTWSNQYPSSEAWIRRPAHFVLLILMITVFGASFILWLGVMSVGIARLPFGSVGKTVCFVVYSACILVPVILMKKSLPT